MDAQKIDQLILALLKRRGYKSAETALMNEARTLEAQEVIANMMLEGDAAILGFISQTTLEATPQRFAESYAQLRNWVSDALDACKQELSVLLYPVFVHFYMELLARSAPAPQVSAFWAQFKDDHVALHGTEMKVIQSITSATSLNENETAQLFRNQKYKVRLSQFTFELLMSFVIENKLHLIQNLMIMHLHVQVVPGYPSLDADVKNEGFLSAGDRREAVLNTKEHYWGLFDDEEKKRAAPEEELPGEEAKKKKAKKDEKQPKPIAKPMFELPKMSENVEKLSQEDRRRRIPLSANALPSVCFFTFFNSHNSLNSISMSNDSSLISTGWSDSAVRVFDLKTKPADSAEQQQLQASAARGASRANKPTHCRTLRGHSGPVYASSWSPDNQFLLSCSEDSSVRLWNVATGTNLVAYRGHNYPVWDVAFSPLGYYFATASYDRTARLWTTSSLTPHRVFAGHLSDVNCVRFHPNCHYTITGSTDKTVRMWDVSTGEPVRIFTGHFDAVRTVAISPDGQIAASAGDDRQIMLWDLASARLIRRLHGHTGRIYSLDFSAEGSLLASGSHDGTVRLWDITRSRNQSDEALQALSQESRSDAVCPELIKSFPTKKTPVSAVKFTPRNLLLAAGSFNDC
jgi:transcription initiation factor TFIID subunit 5